jgi:hypothetical protein
MRKTAAAMLLALGIVVFIATTTTLVRHRLALPPWSLQPEGRWTAYGMHEWAFLVGELPLGLALLLGGYLLWPSRLSRLMGKGIGAISLLIALAGLVTVAGLTHGLLRNVLVSSPAPLTVSELFRFLLPAVAGLAPLLVLTVLAGGVAWKSLQRKEETEWKELPS